MCSWRYRRFCDHLINVPSELDSIAIKVFDSCYYEYYEFFSNSSFLNFYRAKNNLLLKSTINHSHLWSNHPFYSATSYFKTMPLRSNLKKIMPQSILHSAKINQTVWSTSSLKGTLLTCQLQPRLTKQSSVQTTSWHHFCLNSVSKLKLVFWTGHRHWLCIIFFEWLHSLNFRNRGARRWKRLQIWKRRK